MEWVCEICHAAPPRGRCRIRGCAFCDTVTVNRRRFSQRLRNESGKRQEEEERRWSRRSSDDNHSGRELEVPRKVLEDTHSESRGNLSDVISRDSESDVPSKALDPLYDSDFGDRSI